MVLEEVGTTSPPLLFWPTNSPRIQSRVPVHFTIINPLRLWPFKRPEARRRHRQHFTEIFHPWFLVLLPVGSSVDGSSGSAIGGSTAPSISDPLAQKKPVWSHLSCPDHPSWGSNQLVLPPVHFPTMDILTSLRNPEASTGISNHHFLLILNLTKNTSDGKQTGVRV